MAQGSEKFQWNLFPEAPRVCGTCGKRLRVIDVREHRVDFPSQKIRFTCRECFDERTRPQTAQADP